MKALRDTAVLLGRSLRHVQRSPDTVVTVAVMPIAMMLLFVYVFGGAISAGASVGGGPRGYVGYLLPGILLVAVATGVAYTAVRVFADRQQGLVARLRSLPVSRSAVLWAHVLTSLVSTALSLVVIVVVALVMGFRPAAGPLEWLGVVAVLGLFTTALTWLAVVPGLTAKSVDGASGFSYPLVLLPFISSAFVPTDTMPAAVRWFAEHQPVTAVVDALRSLLDGQPAGSATWWALAWCAAAALVAQLLAVRTYRRV